MATLVADILRPTLQSPETPVSATITDVQQLSSYNYVDTEDEKLNLVIPGSPNVWSPPGGSTRLSKDEGLVYIDQHAARHPNYPLEPLFRALYVSHPTLDITSANVITDRNNIRKLLRFISSESKDDFTISVEVIDNTVLLGRHEPQAYEYISSTQFRGYGHMFEKAYTTPQIKGTTGHHRIVSYNFAGMKMIVRHETDGYVGPPSDQAKNETSIFSPISPATTITTSTGLLIHNQGQDIPLSSTLEIKTRARHRPLFFQDVASQLWASQTPKLVRAYHSKGVFPPPVVEDVSAQLRGWEEEKQKELRLLAALMVRIRETVREQGGRAVLKYYGARDYLGVWTAEGERMLPGDLYERFSKGDGGKGE